MATIIYKKFFKKSPTPEKSCIHQREDRSRGIISNEPGLSSPQSNQIDVNNVQHEPEKSQNSSAVSESKPKEICSICKEEKRAANIYRWKLIGGLFLPFSIQALDTTIIAGALPFIASDFNQLSQLNWIVSAFNLTNASFIPFWGQFADVFGRYAALQISLIVTILGSALCAGAPVTAFTMLLFGRALQGVGCAGLLILTKIILADKVSLRENAKNNTIFTIVGGVGYGIGPVLGGFLTQANWRWCFLINIPLAVPGVVLAHFMLRSELVGPQKITRRDGDSEAEVPQSFMARLSTIDFGGQLLFLIGTGLLVLALTWAGAYYPWSDIKVIIPLVLGAVTFMSFLTWESFMLEGRALARRFPTQKPMIPLNLLWTRNLGLLLYINFLTGMAMYAVFYFVDLYFAIVRNYSAGKAGTNLIYYVPGLGVGGYMAMFACNVWPLQTWLPLFAGTLIEPLGITLLAVAIRQGHEPTVFGMLVFTGVGTGIRFMPGTLHGIGYNRNQISKVISLMSLAVTLGGTISTTFMLNVFNNRLARSGITLHSDRSSSFVAISALPDDAQVFFRESARGAIVLAFFALTAFMWLGVLAVLGLGNVRIGKRMKDGGEREDRVTEGSFVVGLIRRRK